MQTTAPRLEPVPRPALADAANHARREGHVFGDVGAVDHEAHLDVLAGNARVEARDPLEVAEGDVAEARVGPQAVHAAREGGRVPV